MSAPRTRFHYPPSRLPGLLLAFFPVVVLACGDGSTAPPDPSELEVAGGDAQTAVVGSELASPLVARAVDGQGEPIRGVSVEWEVTAGGGSLDSLTTRTDDEGLARVTWTLGTGAGSQSVTARAGGDPSTAVSVTFQAQATPDEAVSIELSEESLEFTALTLTSTVSVAGVEDQHGNAISQPDVTWSSSDTEVVEVSASGQVTARANGQAQVQARVDQATASVAVTVDQAAAGVTLDPDTLSFDALGDTLALVAQVVDSEGNAVEEATLSWSSTDDGVVTVDQDGLAVSRGNGQARVVLEATAGPDASPLLQALLATASDSAAVRVEQEAVAVTLTAEADSVEASDTTRLSVEAQDANGAAIEEPDATWSSVEPEVAQVDQTGLVEGRNPGTTQIVVRVDEAADTISIRVTPGAFTPPADTALSGNKEYRTFSVPEGVTVTASNDLTIRVSDSVTIEGSLMGDCVALGVEGTAALTTRGATLDNSCPEGTGSAPALRIEVEGPLTLEDTDFTSSGEMVVTNDPDGAAALVTRVRSEGTGSLNGSLLVANQDGESCLFHRVGMAAPFAADEGLPPERDGSDGADVSLICEGSAVATGVVLVGQDGGAGYSAAGTGSAVGGRGGKGGNAIFGAGGDLVVRVQEADMVESVVEAGDGGVGGDAEAAGDPHAVATAGEGGKGGAALVGAGGGRLIIEAHPEGNATLTVAHGHGGSGGDARAIAADGENDDPPESGGDATATGGSGGDGGGELLFTLEPEGVENAALDAGGAGAGGSAFAQGGRGADGRVDFSFVRQDRQPFNNGAPGGNTFATGGFGGDVRSVQIPAGVSMPVRGLGGSATATGARGGNGVSKCKVGDVGVPGVGGKGGLVQVVGGQDGALDGQMSQNRGPAEVRGAGNGGAGGNGDPGAEGGEPDALSFIDGSPVTNDGGSFLQGAMGSDCNFDTNASVQVDEDPSGHEEFAQFTQVTQLTLALFIGNSFGIFGSDPWVPMSGQFEGDEGSNLRAGGLQNEEQRFNFATSSLGEVAGFSNIRVEVQGQIVADADGNFLRVEGQITIGADGGLPGGQPATYSLFAEREEDQP